MSFSELLHNLAPEDRQEATYLFTERLMLLTDGRREPNANEHAIAIKEVKEWAGILC